MSYSSLSASEYQAIELAIQVSGQSGLNELERGFVQNQQAIAALKAQLAAGAITRDKFQREVAELSRVQARLEESVRAANRVLAGQPAVLRATQAGFGGASRAAL